MIFQKIGGFYQLRLENSEDLAFIPELDEAFWGATSAPLDSFLCDPSFLKYLDTDQNRRIRTDEIKAALAWLFKFLRDRDALDNGSDVLLLEAIDSEHAEGQALRAAAEMVLENLAAEDKSRISLAQIRDRQRILSGAIFNGDGIIPPSVVEDEKQKIFIDDLIKSVGGVDDVGGSQGVDQGKLDQFIAESNSYLQWLDKGKAELEGSPNPILVRGDDTLAANQKICALKDKIDNFFSLCRLLTIDEAVSAKFGFDPGEVAELAVGDSVAVENLLAKAPLTQPTPEVSLNFKAQLNPFYEEQLLDFQKNFFPNKTVMTRDDWLALKKEFTAFDQWWSGKPATAVEPLGEDKIRDYLSSDCAEKLKQLISEDQAVADEVKQLDNIEKLILYQQNFIRFVNNFVSLRHLFDPEQQSMLQVGVLVMDERHFDLNVKVQNRAEHKKVAQKSNICVMYLELTARQGDKDEKMEIATAVTSGFISRLYPGKTGVFFSHDNRIWDAKVIDLLQQPVSLAEAILNPFNKLIDFVKAQVEKFTSSSYKNIETNVGKNLTQVEKNVMTGPQPAKSAGVPWGGMSMFMIGGGISFAAISSAFAYLAKTLKTISLIHLASVLIGIILIVALPIVIAGVVKLRQRNIGMFLEACGWAINAPIRLSWTLSLLFTYAPGFPDGSKFRNRHCDLTKVYLHKNNVRRVRWLFWVFLPIVVLAAWFLGKWLSSYFGLQNLVGVGQL